MKTVSTLEFALMGLLRQKAQSGYDLVIVTNSGHTNIPTASTPEVIKAS